MSKKIKKNSGYVNLYDRNTGKQIVVKENDFANFAKIRMYSLKYGVSMDKITLKELEKIARNEW